MLIVNELFKSVQGEGNEAGRVTAFIRFTGCDFKCPFCDSKHTWTVNENNKKYTPEELFREVEKLKVNHITLTGGNPAIWNDEMREFLEIMKENEYFISMETQGSIYKDWFKLIDNIVISPKNIPNRPINEVKYKETIQTIIDNAQNVIIKTPVFNTDDIQWVKNFVKFNGDYKIYLSVGNEHLDETDGDKFRKLILEKYLWLIEEVLKDEELKNYNVLPQLHTLVWINEQGK